MQGIAFRKDAADLRAAVTEARAGLIADGTDAVREPLLNASSQ